MLYGSGFYATYFGGWWDALEAKRSISRNPGFKHRLRKTSFHRIHSESSVVRRDSWSTHLLRTLGRYSTVIVIPFEGKISQIFFATFFCVVHPWERFGKQISLPGVLARWYATFSPDMSKSRWYTFPVIPPLNLLKVVSVTFLVVCFLSLKENTCETWKKFYFTSKAFFIPQKIKF